MNSGRSRAIKNPHPFLDIRRRDESRKAKLFATLVSIYTRGATLIAFLCFSGIQALVTPYVYHIVAARWKGHLFLVIALRGNHPPVLLAYVCQDTSGCSLIEGFLGTAAHEGVLRRRIRSELSPSIESLLVAVLVLFSFNAGQLV
jgi:hypothetical protein